MCQFSHRTLSRLQPDHCLVLCQYLTHSEALPCPLVPAGHRTSTHRWACTREISRFVIVARIQRPHLHKLTPSLISPKSKLWRAKTPCNKPGTVPAPRYQAIQRSVIGVVVASGNEKLRHLETVGNMMQQEYKVL